MAVYRVAQDVEAEDKLLGPFSFRQFIYLIIAVIGIGLAWGLSQLFLPLFIIPIPIILLFGVLALPLRKDQPMETYLGALISYFLKPRRRLWEPDGIETTIEITAVKNDDIMRTKDLTTTEAQRRLAYLADLADTRGWSIRHSTMPNEQAVGAMVQDVYNEAQQTKDILSDEGNVAQAFEDMIGKADQKRRQQLMERMKTPTATPIPAAAAPQPITQQQPQQAPQAEPQHTTLAPQPDTTEEPLHGQELRYNPYPNMRQSVISPDGQDSRPQSLDSPRSPSDAVTQTATNAAVAQPPVGDSSQQMAQTPTSDQAPSTSVTPPSADILELANNTDLSIETIAHEAKRRSDKSNDNEVVISLR